VSISDAAPMSDGPMSSTSIERLHTRWKLGLLLLALTLLALDQWTKWLAVTHLSYGVPMPVCAPWLNWTLVHNFGAAFSFLSNSGGLQHWFFSGVALLAVLGLPLWITRLTRHERVLSVALSMVWAGALGNLIDRLRFRYVIDFIHVHWKDAWHYPVFNVADSAITVGAVMLLGYELAGWLRARRA
jgi:signal peptidase II